ncbi:MAG TPA: hypothetical protein PLG46_07390 [Ornithinibacter sp.]|nr:hypothetical protein [Ornithinibacter sp.]
MSETTCTLDDCDKPVKRKGLCYGHYMKQWRYGTATPAHPSKRTDLAGRRFGSLVAIEPTGSRWLCACDCGASSVVRVGDLNRGTTSNCGDRAEHHRRDDIRYAAAHDRVRSDRGLVQQYPCIDCGTAAQHWSYNHDDPDELEQEGLSAQPVAYSIHPEHYSPRCITCHRRFDVRHANARRLSDAVQ